MSNPTDTNQASEVLEAKLSTIIFARFYDIPDKQRSTIVKNLSKLIRNEKLKLLAEVRERVVGEDTQNPYSKSSDRFFNDWGHQASEYDKFIRGGMRDKLTKLEAEL